jgi:hypothetical protein
MIVAGFPSTQGAGPGGGGGLVASANPASLSKEGTTSSLTTDTTTVTASGGTPPYTYDWGAVGVNVNSPGSATTSFTKTGLAAPGSSYSTTATCAVEDSAGGATTVNVPLYFERTGGS